MVRPFEIYGASGREWLEPGDVVAEDRLPTGGVADAMAALGLLEPCDYDLSELARGE